MAKASVSAVLAAVALVAAGCSKPRNAIDVKDNIVLIENQTAGEWHNVVVTVNDHFRGGAPRLAAHGVLNAPLSQFQTGNGQRFVLGRHVFKVEVTAKDVDGGDVRLVWGTEARR